MAKYIPKAQPVDAYQVQDIVSINVALDDGSTDTVPSANSGDYVIHLADGSKSVMDQTAFNAAYELAPVIPQ